MSFNHYVQLHKDFYENDQYIHIDGGCIIPPAVWARQQNGTLTTHDIAAAKKTRSQKIIAFIVASVIQQRPLDKRKTLPQKLLDDFREYCLDFCGHEKEFEWVTDLLSFTDLIDPKASKIKGFFHKAHTFFSHVSEKDMIKVLENMQSCPSSLTHLDASTIQIILSKISDIEYKAQFVNIFVRTVNNYTLRKVMLEEYLSHKEFSEYYPDDFNFQKIHHGMIHIDRRVKYFLDVNVTIQKQVDFAHLLNVYGYDQLSELVSEWHYRFPLLHYQTVLATHLSDDDFPRFMHDMNCIKKAKINIPDENLRTIIFERMEKHLGMKPNKWLYQINSLHRNILSDAGEAISNNDVWKAYSTVSNSMSELTLL